MNVPIQQLGAHFADPAVPGPTISTCFRTARRSWRLTNKGTRIPGGRRGGHRYAAHGVTFTQGSDTSPGLAGGGDVALGGQTLAILQPGDGAKPAKLLAADVGNGPEAAIIADDMDAFRVIWRDARLDPGPVGDIRSILWRLALLQSFLQLRFELERQHGRPDSPGYIRGLFFQPGCFGV